MPMKETYESIEVLTDCKKLITTKKGEKLIFDAQNDFEKTFTVQLKETPKTKQVPIEMLDDGYSDSSDTVVGAVIGLLVLGILGVIGFLQWKFVLCKQFLCIKCSKKAEKSKKRKEKETPDADDDQFNANDLIKNRKKWDNDLPEGISDDDSES